MVKTQVIEETGYEKPANSKDENNGAVV